MDTKAMKTILITGGSRGIGKATALLAGAKGWAVIVNYRSDKQAAEETADEVRSNGGRAHIIKCDVSNENDVIDLFAKADKKFGPIDAVIINAGIVAPSMKLVEMSAERLIDMLNINLLGALLSAREAARWLGKRDDAIAQTTDKSIVFVSSAASKLGSPNEYVDYAATKGALDTLTIGLSKELAPQNIRVNAVRPGLIETELHASGGQPQRAQKLSHDVPMERPGTAMEVAEAIIWLSSNQASYTTGAILDVSGGR